MTHSQLEEGALWRPVSRRSVLRGGTGLAGVFMLGSTGALLEACSNASNSSSGNSAKKTLTYGAWQAPDTLDPATTGLAATSRIIAQVFDTLLYQLAGETKLLPGLATSWEVSPDAKLYTLKLRTGVKFHDGTPFDAKAVQFTFDRIANPQTKALSALGALGPYSHSTVVDDHTIQVAFDSPYAPFLNVLSQVILAPVSPTAVQKYGQDFGSHPVGTGPFMVKDYAQRDHVTLVRNPDYNWAPAFYGQNGPAALESIKWRIIPEDATRMGTLQTGEADVIEYLVPQSVAQFKSNSKYKVLLIDAPGSPRVIMINVTKPPTDDLAVRQAMLYAVDQKTIVDVLFKDVYKSASSPLEPPTLGYDASIAGMYTANPTKAAQLLDGAGWKMGSGGIRQKNGVALKALFINIANDQFDQIAQIVQADLRKVGIDLQLQNESEPTVFSTYNQGPQNFSEIFYWFNDPSLLYSLYHSSQIAHGFNWGHYSNPQVDELLVRGGATPDPAQRVTIYRQAQQQIMKDAVIMPIQSKRTVMALNASIDGMRFTSITYPLLYATKWK
jgi:peptide/nickel transport system substrate-binding protein